MTPEVRDALDFITVQAASGVCASLDEVQAALNKKSRSHTLLVLRRMKEAGLIDWETGQQRTLRPAKKGKSRLLVARRYLVGEKVKWPLGKWSAVDSHWLDPKMFNLSPAQKYIVLEAGSLWAPKNIQVTKGEKLVVAVGLKFPADGTSFVHRKGQLEAEKVFLAERGIFRVEGTGQVVEKADYLGGIVARAWG